MEQLIHAFGIDVRLILMQVVNFGLLMAALTYFLYKPVLKILKEREEKIAKGIEDAKAAEVARASAEEEKKGIIATANKDAEAMTTRATEHANTRAEQIVADAHKKADQVIKDAGDRSSEMKTQILRESEAEIAKLAVLAAEKVLKERTS
jgi:F-type H+-transporting ATPase subunit b